MKYKKTLSALLCISLILGGSFYYIQSLPSYSIMRLAAEIRKNGSVEKYIAVDNFTDSLGREVWRNVNSGSKLLQKFEKLDKSFQPFLSKMIGSYTKSVLENRSKLIKVSELSYFNYLGLQAKIFSFVISKKHHYTSKNLAKISIEDIQLAKYQMSFDLLFQKKDQLWQVYAIENLEL